MAHIVRMDAFKFLSNSPFKSGKLWLDVRGTNGSGKTTFVRDILGKNLISIVVGEKAIATASADSDWVALGDYSSSSPTNVGGDGIPKKDCILKIMEFLWQSGYNVVVEGIMIATTFSTYANHYNHLSELIGSRKVKIVMLNTELDVIFDRVRVRRGKLTDSTKDRITQKYFGIQRQIPKWLSCGFEVCEVSNWEDFKLKCLK